MIVDESLRYNIFVIITTVIFLSIIIYFSPKQHIISNERLYELCMEANYTK